MRPEANVATSNLGHHLEIPVKLYARALIERLRAGSSGQCTHPVRKCGQARVVRCEEESVAALEAFEVADANQAHGLSG